MNREVVLLYRSYEFKYAIHESLVFLKHVHCFKICADLNSPILWLSQHNSTLNTKTYQENISGKPHFLFSS